MHMYSEFEQVNGAVVNDLIADIAERERVIEVQKQKIISLLENEKKVIEAVSVAFGKLPVACDGALLVSQDHYNRIVDTLST